MVGLAILDPPHRKAASTSAAGAAAWTALAVISIRTKIEPVPPGSQRWAGVVYRSIFDPDGRPLRLRMRHGF
jgi:hypothetical protein